MLSLYYLIYLPIHLFVCVFGCLFFHSFIRSFIHFILIKYWRPIPKGHWALVEIGNWNKILDEVIGSLVGSSFRFLFIFILKT